MSKAAQYSASFGASAESKTVGATAAITAGVLLIRLADSSLGHCEMSAAVSSTSITGQSARPKSSPA